MRGSRCAVRFSGNPVGGSTDGELDVQDLCRSRSEPFIERGVADGVDTVPTGAGSYTVGGRGGYADWARPASRARDRADVP